MAETKKKWWAALAVLLGAALLVGGDQASKAMVLENLRGKPPVAVIPGLLEFSYVENYAAAMGLFDGLIWLVVACTAVVCVFILLALLFYKGHTVFSYITAMLLLAGGLGNLIDRFSHGFVVDFIHVLFFPYIFNVADCCVTIGVVCFFCQYLVTARREKTEKEAAGEG